MAKKKPKKLHVKPTQEELDEGMKKAAAEAEALKDKPEEPKVPEVELETPEKEPEKEPEPSPDYKKKFVESTREGQVLHARSKKLTEAIEEAGEVTEPTDEEMAKEYSDWEILDDFQKKMARDAYVSSKRFNVLSEATKEFKDLDKWRDKVDKFIDDPKTLIDNSRLEGRQDEFRLFAGKPTRRGIDFEDLVSAFLYTVEKEAKPMKKGKMFETGSGGPVKPEKEPGKLTLEDSRQLRETDYKKWRELTKAGKISTEI